MGAEPKVHEELLQQRSLIGEQPGCTVPEDFHPGECGGDVDGGHHDHYNHSHRNHHHIMIHKAKNPLMVATDQNHQDVKEDQDQYYKFNQMVHYDAGIWCDVVMWWWCDVVIMWIYIYPWAPCW